MPVLYALLFLTLALLPVNAHAHPGHEWDSALAQLVHPAHILIGALLAMAAAVALLLKSRNADRHIPVREKNNETK